MNVVSCERVVVGKRDKHLDMALLQTALDLVEIGLVEMVAVVRGDYIPFCCCLGHAALEVLVIKAVTAWLVLLYRRHFCKRCPTTCKLVEVWGTKSKLP